MAVSPQTLVTAVGSVCADIRQVQYELTNMALARQAKIRLERIAAQFEKLGETEIAVLCREPAKLLQMFIDEGERRQTWEDKGIRYIQGQFGGLLTGQIQAVEAAVERWAAAREK